MVGTLMICIISDTHDKQYSRFCQLISHYWIVLGSERAEDFQSQLIVEC
jgi:hypothetical protein